jgi:hypothetical protein
MPSGANAAELQACYFVLDGKGNFCTKLCYLDVYFDGERWKM